MLVDNSQARHEKMKQGEDPSYTPWFIGDPQDIITDIVRVKYHHEEKAPKGYVHLTAEDPNRNGQGRDFESLYALPAPEVVEWWKRTMWIQDDRRPEDLDLHFELIRWKDSIALWAQHSHILGSTLVAVFPAPTKTTDKREAGIDELGLRSHPLN